MALRFGPTLLAALGLVAGTLVGGAERWLIAPAVNGDPPGTGAHRTRPLARVHADPAALSVLTLALGFGLYRSRARWLATVSGWDAQALTSDTGSRVGRRLERAAARGRLAVLTRRLQNGSLRRYLAVTLAPSRASRSRLWGLLAGE